MCSLLSLRTGSAGANIRFFPDDGRLSVSWELGRREWFNEAETSSPLAGFGLTPSSSGRTTPFAWIAPDRIASRASLLPPADAQLDVERTILIIDTFQPIRTTSHCWCNQEATEGTEPDSILCFLSFLLLDWQSENYCVDHANYPDAFLSVSICEFFVPWQGRPSR